jgi:urease accessory protein
MRRALLPIFAVAASLAASPAFAHPGHGESGFAAGFSHPFGGADHLLAMLAVGAWAAMAGGRAGWAWPAAFVAAMAAGFVAGASDVGLPLVEAMILASVAVFGAALVFRWKLSPAAGAAMIAVFAAAHGFAHGQEAPASGLAAFAGGFALATGLIHLAGYSLYRLAARVRRLAPTRNG